MEDGEYIESQDVKYTDNQEDKTVNNEIKDYINNSFGDYYDDKYKKDSEDSDEENGNINLEMVGNLIRSLTETMKGMRCFDNSFFDNIDNIKDKLDIKDDDSKDSNNNYYLANYENFKVYKNDLIFDRILPPFIELQFLSTIKQKFKDEKYKIIASLFNINETCLLSIIANKAYHYFKQHDFIFPKTEIREKEFTANFIKLINEDIRRRMFYLKLDDKHYEYIVEQIKKMLNKVSETVYVFINDDYYHSNISG